MFSQAVLVSSLLAIAVAQQPGNDTKEVHPPLPIQKCGAGGCTTLKTAVTLDANWRWLHDDKSENCYAAGAWDAEICPDGKTCAKECYLDGAEYAETYGIEATDNALKMQFVTEGTGRNVGSRVYLMASKTKYQMFHLLNQEFTFDVDVSQLPCGLNGALYFSEMEEDGGLKKFPGNKAGAEYGTGYCDAQCPKDIKFINGEANSEGWKTSGSGSGTGQYGSCCNEMDIWEANSMASAYTPHVCTKDGQTRCEGEDCNGSVCDKPGCDFNSYRMGNESFFGPNKVVDTTKPFTIVTQFITDDNTDTGTLVEIRRQYVQGGKVISNSNVDIPGIDPVNSITDDFCAQQKKVFGDENVYAKLGGTTAMGKAFSRGMVLTLSIWDDYAANMLWLDSDYPPTADPSKAGTTRGPCDASSGKPADVEAKYPDASVIYSNIKFGAIGSTYKGKAIVPGESSSKPAPAGTSSTTVKKGTSSTTTKTGSSSTASVAGYTLKGQSTTVAAASTSSSSVVNYSAPSSSSSFSNSTTLAAVTTSSTSSVATSSTSGKPIAEHTCV